MSGRQDHWQHVYATKTDEQVSWFEASPETSMALLEAAGPVAGAVVIDVGGGASRLVDALLEARAAHVSVLDLSSAALERSKARLGDQSRVAWIATDICDWTPDRRYDLWHDRAAFHFLVDPADRARYVTVLHAALRPGGRAVIGTFALDGPEKCSGLPVARHDAYTLAAALGEGFELIAQQTHEHTTPWGSVQKFQFATFERR
jgi:SAM-dependent methyltransferase